MKRAKFVPLFAALLVAALPATASAASVEILSPQDDKHERDSRLEVKVAAKGPKFRVSAGGRDVTKRFSGSGSTRRARLRLGRDVPYGRSTLSASVGAPRQGKLRVDAITVTALRREPAFASMKSRKLTPRHPAPMINVRARKRLAEARVWLNGKRVTPQLPLRSDLHGVRGVLGSHAGLRFGRNKVVVELQRRNGIYDRERQTFRIDRKAPLAGAGEDFAVNAGTPAKLGGAATKHPGSPQATSYSWEVLDAPKGSQPRLTAPNSQAPGFVADERGSYTLRLTASNGEGGAVDDVEVAVGDPQETEVGVPIQSISDDGSVRIGSTSKPMESGMAYHLVVVDDKGSVLDQPVGDQQFAAGKEGNLKTAIMNTDPGDRVVLTGGGVSAGKQRGFDPKTLEAAIVLLGGTVSPADDYSSNFAQTPNGAKDLGNGQWTVYGHRGLKEGQAEQTFAVTQAPVPGAFGGDAGRPGSLNGYLQVVKDSTLSSNVLEYASPETVALDTKAGCATGSRSCGSPATCTPTAQMPCSSDTRNVVRIGSQFHESSAIPRGALGMQVLAFKPSAGLQIFVNESFVLTNPNGATNYGSATTGVEGLARRVNSLVNSRDPKAPYDAPLVILQTFGAPPKAGTSPKQSSFWVNDQVPSSDQPDDWENQAYPTKPLDLFKIWNPGKGSNGTPASYPTVAGVVGQLAGPEAHDLVANFGYGFATVPEGGDSEPKPSTNPYPLPVERGLTVVATAHSYDPGDGYAERQADYPKAGQRPSPLAGGAVGTLRRNHQGQWQLTNPTLADSLPYRASENSPLTEQPFNTDALWKLAFAAPQPFPCSAERPAPCSSAAAATAAMTYIAEEAPSVAEVGSLDIRERYAKNDGTFTSNLVSSQDAVSRVAFPSVGSPGFTADDLADLKNLLADPVTGEFEQVNRVFSGISAWQSLFGASSGDEELVDAQAITEGIVKIVLADENTAELEAQINAKEAVSSGLLIFAEVSEVVIEAAGSEVPGVAALPSVLGAVSAAIDFSTEVTPQDQSIVVEHDEEQIRAKASEISKDIGDRFSNIQSNLSQLGEIFVSDGGKLAQASANFENVWDLNDDFRTQQARANTTAAARELYEGLTPLAFILPVISPHSTGDSDEVGRNGQNNGGPRDDLRIYNCGNVVDSNDSEDFTFDGFLNPFDRVPRSAFHTLHHRRADGADGGAHPRESGTGAQIGLALKGSKAKFNAQDTDDEDIGIRNRGSDPPASLTNRLFRTVDPGAAVATIDSLGMSKDEFFFVGRWDTKRIQCGS